MAHNCSIGCAVTVKTFLVTNICIPVTHSPVASTPVRSSPLLLSLGIAVN